MLKVDIYVTYKKEVIFFSSFGPIFFQQEMLKIKPKYGGSLFRVIQVLTCQFMFAVIAMVYLFIYFSQKKLVQ